MNDIAPHQYWRKIQLNQSANQPIYIKQIFNVYFMPLSIMKATLLYHSSVQKAIF